MYSTNIEPSEDSLRMLDEKFTQVAEDRFFYKSSADEVDYRRCS